MSKRGRPSFASLATLANPAGRIQIMDRLKAPHDLTDEEVEIWVAVTEAESADWFNAGNAPLLTQYARHVVRARHVAEMIERALADKDVPMSISGYDLVLKMQARESAVISSLATKMRISQQSTTNHRGNKKTQASSKPWIVA